MSPTDRQMDDLDLRLVDLLRAQGRMSMADLGRSVGLSRTAVLARVQRLERAGVIRGYRADVAVPGATAAHRARIGIVHRTPDVGGYVRRLSGLPGVLEIETVAGEYDLIVLVTAATSDGLDQVLDQIAALRETVRTTTWVVLRRYGSDPGR